MPDTKTFLTGKKVYERSFFPQHNELAYINSCFLGEFLSSSGGDELNFIKRSEKVSETKNFSAAYAVTVFVKRAVCRYVECSKGSTDESGCLCMERNLN